MRTGAVNLARCRWRRAQRLVGLGPRLVEQPRGSNTEGHLVLLGLRRLPAAQREVIALHHRLYDERAVQTLKIIKAATARVHPR